MNNFVKKKNISSFIKINTIITLITNVFTWQDSIDIVTFIISILGKVKQFCVHYSSISAMITYLINSLKNSLRRFKNILNKLQQIVIYSEECTIMFPLTNLTMQGMASVIAAKCNLITQDLTIIC